MSEVVRRTRGGGAARPLTAAERAQAEAAKTLLRGALETCWGESDWTVLRSRSQDGRTLRISVLWTEGPSEDDVIALAETLDWPAGLPITLGLRRRPTCDERHPTLHRIQRASA